MRSVGACCLLWVRVVYAGRVDCLRCVELLPTPVRAAAMMNSHRGQGCWWYCRSERSAGRTGTGELMWHSLVESGVVDVDWLTWPAEAHILFHFRWAECEPIGGGAEVADAGWLASVLRFRQPSGELQCIKTACACYVASVDQGVCLSVRLWVKESHRLYDCGRFPHTLIRNGDQ
jgi:hypothetical protein